MRTSRVLNFLALAGLSSLSALPVSAQWSAINGPNGQAVLSFLARGQELHVGTARGLHMSEDGGGHWKAMRLGVEARTLAAGEGYLLAGLKAGLLRRSIGAAGWDPVAAGLPDSQEVAVATLGRWAFAGAGPVVLRSADQGRSWAKAWEEPAGDILHRLWSDGPDLFASLKQNKLLRSADSGTTWIQVGSGTRGSAFDLVRIGETILLCSGWGLSRLGEDGSWKPIGPETGTYLMNLYRLGDTLYYDAWNGVFRSVDTGATWEPFTEFFGGSRDVRTLVRTGDDLFAGTLTGMYRSRDGGRTWAGMNAGLQGHMVWSFASQGDRLYAATEWGLFQSSDGGASWNRLDSLIGGQAAYLVGAGSGRVFVEGLSNGRWRSLDGGDTWIPFGDGLPVTSGLRYIHDIHVLGEIVFATVFGMGLYRSEDWGGSWQQIQHETGFLSVFDMVSHGNDLFLAGELSVYRSGDQGRTWSLAWPDTAAPGGPSHIATLGPYLLADGPQGIYRTSDRGITWSRVDRNLPGGSVRELVVVDERFLVARLEDSLFVSRDTGVTWSPWQEGLGAKPRILGLAVHGGRLLAGTMEGVWARHLAELGSVGLRPESGLARRQQEGAGQMILWNGRGSPRLHWHGAAGRGSAGRGLFDARGRMQEAVPLD